MGISLAGKRRYILFVVLVVQLLGLVCLAAKYEVLKTDLKVAQQNIESNLRLTMGEIDAATAQERVVIDPKESMVYLPEFRVKLPYDDISKSLLYSMREEADETNSEDEGKNPEADVRSTLYQEEFEFARIDCSILVRLKVEDKPNAYSPHEKPVTVNLQDGRKLQVYESFDQKECNDAWINSITPALVGTTFQKAQSY